MNSSLLPVNDGICPPRANNNCSAVQKRLEGWTVVSVMKANVGFSLYKSKHLLEILLKILSQNVYSLSRFFN
jgi:hypothetical protein